MLFWIIAIAAALLAGPLVAWPLLRGAGQVAPR